MGRYARSMSTFSRNSGGGALARSSAAVPCFNSWFVATDGDSENDGRIGSPWDIASALLNTVDVQPGDTIWLRGGTYYYPTRQPGEYGYPVNLQGSAVAPIIVRAYPGERATIDGGLQSNGANIPQYVWIWDLEVIVSENQTETRTSIYAGSGAPADLVRPWGGMNFVTGTGLKFINNVLHDNMQGAGFWGLVKGDSEFYGNVVYDNYWNGSDRLHGHGIYTQNPADPDLHTDWKYITANIFADTSYFGIHAYGGGSSYTERYRIEHNITVGVSGILAGGEGTTDELEVIENFCADRIRGAYGGTMLSATWTDNSSFPDKIAINDFTDLTESNNFSWHLEFWDYPQIDGVTQPAPTEARTFTVVNAYDSNRLHVAVMDFPDPEDPGYPNGATLYDGSVPVDVSGFLAVGDDYDILDPRDFYGTPLASGTYAGGNLTFPMTVQYFDAFLLVNKH